MTTYKHIRCTKCGFRTNAWIDIEKVPDVICNGCYQLQNKYENFKQAAANGSWLAKGLLDSARDTANMPDWYQRLNKKEAERIAESGRQPE